MPTYLFHTNDTWNLHRILWSGEAVASGLTLFEDAYFAYITGSHYAALSGYSSIVTISRITFPTTMIPSGFAMAGYSGGGGAIYYPDGPTAFSMGKVANYLNEWGEALGMAYMEQKTASGGGNKGLIHFYEGYPITEIGWDTTSGTGYYMNDIIGVDYPDSPRLLISSPEVYPQNSPGVTVVEVAVMSGLAYAIQSPSVFLNLPSGISVTDIESQRYL